MNINPLQILNSAIQIAADELSKERVQKIHMKGARDFSTNIDISIEEKIRKYLISQTPSFTVIGEEKSPEFGNFDYAWIIDPIDGTVNFQREHPFYGVSLALITPKEPIAAAILLPSLDRLYLAEKGSGAFCNGQKLNCSPTKTMDAAIIAFGDFAVGNNSDQKNEQRLSMISKLAEKALRVRMHGSASIDMCYVADGTIDASVTLSNNIWDMQAGVLLVREAGGIVNDRSGSPHCIYSDSTICGNKFITKELMNIA